MFRRTKSYQIWSIFVLILFDSFNFTFNIRFVSCLDLRFFPNLDTPMTMNTVSNLLKVECVRS